MEKNISSAVVVDEEEKFFSENVESFWKMTWKRFKKHKLAVAGLIVLAFLVLVAVFAPLICPYGYEELHLDCVTEGKPLSPNTRVTTESGSYWFIFGTDVLGRDYFTRCVYGGRISLSVGFVATAISLAIGIPLGAVAGYYRGVPDMIISRLVEFIGAIPTFPLLLTLNAALENCSIYLVMVIIGVFGWGGVCRQVRGQFLSLRQQEFVQAASALGYKDGRVIFRHILPNALTPVIVSATMSVAGAILTESSLSYLGLGVQEPVPSWGSMLKAGKTWLRDAAHLSFIPGLLILIVTLSLNFVGDGLRDALDPRNTRQ